MTQAGLNFYRNEDWEGIRHGVFTRQGGVSQAQWRSLNLGASNGDDIDALHENHARIYQAASLNSKRVVSSWLVHSTDTLVVTKDAPTNGHLAKADAIITDQPDTPLVMRYADCVPLLLYDREKAAIGLGHAGWRGTVNGMAAKMISAMQATYGSFPQDIEAVIGPAISRRNYRVGEEVARQANAYFGEPSGVIWRDPADGSAYFDLWAANQMDLQRCGVRHVKVFDICTYENTDEFFSHRAENGATGRFGVAISL